MTWQWRQRAVMVSTAVLFVYQRMLLMSCSARDVGCRQLTPNNKTAGAHFLTHPVTEHVRYIYFRLTTARETYANTSQKQSQQDVRNFMENNFIYPFKPPSLLTRTFPHISCLSLRRLSAISMLYTRADVMTIDWRHLSQSKDISDHKPRACCGVITSLFNQSIESNGFIISSRAR